MPSYEIALIVRSALSRPKLKTAVKGACEQILKHGGLIRQVENLGHRELPHPVRAHRHNHKYGNYFCIQLDCSSEAMAEIDKQYRQANQIVRFGVVRKEEPPRRPCLDGPCLFGELPNPDHDRAAYTKNVLHRFKNRKMANV